MSEDRMDELEWLNQTYLEKANVETIKRLVSNESDWALLGQENLTKSIAQEEYVDNNEAN